MSIPFYHLKFFCEAESITYDLMSEYLNETSQKIDNISFSNKLKSESVPLDNISNNFKELYYLYVDFEDSVINNTFFKSLKSSKNQILNITNKIDMIIEEQEKIIQINEELP